MAVREVTAQHAVGNAGLASQGKCVQEVARGARGAV